MMYIGVRSCKTSTEEDFEYLSSSKYIKEVIKQFGKNVFAKIILHVHPNRETAVLNEMYLQQKYNVVKSANYYNKAIQKGTGFDTTGLRFKMSDKDIKAQSQRMLGNKLSQATKDKIGAAHKGRTRPQSAINKGKETVKNKSQEEKDKTSKLLSIASTGRVHTEATKQLMSKLALERPPVSTETKDKLSLSASTRVRRPHTEETKEKKRLQKRFNNGVKNFVLNPNDVPEGYEPGWIKCLKQ